MNVTNLSLASELLTIYLVNGILVRIISEKGEKIRIINRTEWNTHTHTQWLSYYYVHLHLDVVTVQTDGSLHAMRIFNA